MSKSFRENRDWDPVIQHQKPNELDPGSIDAIQYRELAFRAIYEILQSLKITERVLKT